MADETLFVVIRDKNFMAEGEVRLLVMKGDPGVTIRKLHGYVQFSGIADIFSLQPDAPVAHEREGYAGLRELGTVLKHYGSTRSAGEYGDSYTGLWACINRLPEQQQPLELQRVLDRAREELESRVKRGEVNGQTPETNSTGMPPSSGTGA